MITDSGIHRCSRRSSLDERERLCAMKHDFGRGGMHGD